MLLFATPAGAINDLSQHTLRHDPLYLPSLPQKGIAIPGSYLASNAVIVHACCFRADANMTSYDRRSHMVNREMSANAFLVGFEMGRQHLPCSKFHVVCHGPC